MAVLTAAREVPAHKQVIDGAYFVDFPVAASTAIYKGGFVAVNRTGYLVRFAPETLTAVQGSHLFVGIGQEEIASQTADGDATCRVMIEGYFEHALTSATVADVGKSVYATDDNTLALSGACSIDVIGHIVYLESAASVIVKMKTFFGSGPGEITRVINAFNVMTAGSTVMLLHESENHNGGWLSDLATVVTTAIDTDSADGVVTIAHTSATETSLLNTLTYLDNTVANDLIISLASGSKVFGIGSATADSMIPIPADVAVMAVLTTVGNGTGTPVGVADIVAKIILL